VPTARLREFNAVTKDIRKVDVLFGYCYPSTYRAGMTGLATHIFYSVLNAREDTSCERYFRYDVPSPGRSVETARPLHENHIVGFSLTYEENILGMIQMLDLGGVPVLARDREDKHPIVLVGGPVVNSNPEPYVDFVDAFVIGEGDLVVHDIIDAVRESSSREGALEKIALLKGIYVPAANPSSVTRLIMKDIDSVFHPTAQIVPDVPVGAKLEPVFGKSFLLEVARGCGHSCKFCLIGHVCRPRRVRSIGRLKEIIEIGLQETPVRKIALIASSPGDLKELEDLADWIVTQDLQMSAPSLRADTVTERLLASLVAGGQRTLTIAPETGLESLRSAMGKGLSDDAIENAVSLAAQAGYKAIKLYFIVGLPGETDEDVEAIPEMVKRLSSGRRLRISVGINPFIPKAQTRLQRNAQPPIEVIRHKIRAVERGLRNVPRVNVESLDPRNARIQAALSLGDRSIGKVIRRAASYDGLSGWRRAEKETNIPFFSLANDAQRLQGPLPWSIIKGQK